MLVGNKVILRRIEKADLWQLWKWHEENELYLFYRIDPSISYDMLNERFAEYFNFRGDFLIESKEGKPLGVVSYMDIIWKNRSCEIVFKVCEDDANQTVLLGSLATLLTFVFEEFNLFKVQAFVVEYSVNDTTALEKIGFRLEGKLREHIFQGGGYKDLLLYALFRDDFISA